MEDQWANMWLILIRLGACYKAKYNKLPVSSAVCLCVPGPSVLLSISESLLAWGELLERLELLWVRAPGPSSWSSSALLCQDCFLCGSFFLFVLSSVTDWYYFYHHLANSSYLEVEESRISHPYVYLANGNYLNRKWAQATLIYHEKKQAGKRQRDAVNELLLLMADWPCY